MSDQDVPPEDARPADMPGFGMTDLDEKFSGLEGEAVRAEILSRLAQLARNMDVKVRAGLRPEGYARAIAIKKAAEAAQVFLTGKTGRS